jgi:eukaryotic-like serine/threonine-protein kinase
MFENKKTEGPKSTPNDEAPSESVAAQETVTYELPSGPLVSDVLLAEASTGVAPTFPAPSLPPGAPAPPPEKRVPANQANFALLPGAKVDDFEIVRLLGRGAFGHVYLARQLSLDRQVALKVSANRGSEGRTMARLEHQHIVQVFSETVDADFNQRLLCMQLVPGIGLEKLIGVLHKRVEGSIESTPDWTGTELLRIIDHSTSLPAALDPSALRDREALASMDAVDATSWFGSRLAEALDFAHRHGVLHRDIKPANILVNSYGRPLLADFNISSQPLGSEPSGDEMFGGTFAYMAPEHLDAFNPEDPTDQEAVTACSDLYSLGLVLQQLLDGRMVFPMAQRKPRMVDTLRALADERRGKRPTVAAGPPGARKTLERTIARCLESDPSDRFASGAELGEQLNGCQRLRQAERQLPSLPPLLVPITRHPFLWLVLLVILPQLAGSVVNILYNATQIVGQLTTAQQQFFTALVIGYNAIVYPIGVVVLVLAVRPVWRCWNALASTEAMTDSSVQAARRRALKLPRWIALLTAAGWFPGGFIFPVAIAIYRPPLEFNLAAHFVASFCLSGLIALAYSLCGAQFVVLRLLYPGMWRDVRSFSATTKAELSVMAGRLSRIEILAGSIPLVAVLMLTLGGETANPTFPYLVSGLIVLGMFGFHFASAVTRGLAQVVVALTTTKG